MCFLFLISPTFSPQYTFPFMKTPFFQYNSMYDTWQIPNILQVTCKFPKDCSKAEQEAVLGYRKVTHAYSPLCKVVVGHTSQGDVNHQTLLWQPTAPFFKVVTSSAIQNVDYVHQALYK